MRERQEACRALTDRNERCSMWAVGDEEFCSRHLERFLFWGLRRLDHSLATHLHCLSEEKPTPYEYADFISCATSIRERFRALDRIESRPRGQEPSLYLAEWRDSRQPFLKIGRAINPTKRSSRFAPISVVEGHGYRENEVHLLFASHRVSPVDLPEAMRFADGSTEWFHDVDEIRSWFRVQARSVA